MLVILLVTAITNADCINTSPFVAHMPIVQVVNVQRSISNTTLFTTKTRTLQLGTAVILPVVTSQIVSVIL